MCLLRRVLYVRVDEKRIGFTVDVLDSYLEAVEATGFRGCDLRREVAAEVPIDDAIRCSKGGEDVGDEVVFVGIEMGPICGVGLEVDMLHHFTLFYTMINYRTL